MKKTTLTVLALAATLALGACKQEDKAAETAAAAPAPVAALPVPTSTSDTKAWQAYLKPLVVKHMDKRYKRPYTYFVPAAGGDEEQRQYDAQLESAQAAVARGILAGTMLAFGGPDPGRTAQVMIDSFKLAGPGSLKGVRVVFIGTADQDARVREALVPTGAEYVFEDMGTLPAYTTPDQAASMPGQAPAEEAPADAPADAPAETETPPEGE